MKLVIAIVNNDDATAVASSLTKNGIPATKMASTGGFLRAGNTTFIIGIDAEKVEKVVKLIASCSKKRVEVLPETTAYSGGMYSGMPVEVTVGGATLFVVDVERFEKL